MKDPTEKVPLSIDILDTVRSYLDQCARYYYYEYGRFPSREKLHLTRLCNDHKDPVLSIIDDHPVLNISTDQWVGIFGYEKYHFFPGLETLFRLAVFCRLDLPQTISLLLKAKWEQMASPAGYPNGNTHLNQHLNHLNHKRPVGKFKPKTKAIFKLVKHIPYKTHYIKSRFLVVDLSRELINTGLYLGPSSKVAQIFNSKRSESFNRAAINRYQWDLSSLK